MSSSQVFETAPEAAPDAAPEAAPEAAPDAAPDAAAPEAAPEAAQGATQGATDTEQDTPYTERAIYHSAENAFRFKQPPVPRHVFVAERDQAFDPATGTGLIPLDLSDRLDTPFPATTPFLLARYAKIRAGDTLSTRLKAGGEIYYVIRGTGATANGADRIAWAPGDVFCLPGGDETTHRAGDGDVILYMITDEPQLALSHFEPPAPGNAAVAAVHYPAAEIRRHLDAVLAEPTGAAATGRAVLFTSAPTERTRVCLPSIALAINSLEPGRSQRPHRHNAAALTLCIQGKGCHSTIEGERVDWRPDAVMVTPPTELHAHHNAGDQLMVSLVAQDGGLFYHARAVGFSF